MRDVVAADADHPPRRGMIPARQRSGRRLARDVRHHQPHHTAPAATAKDRSFTATKSRTVGQPCASNHKLEPVRSGGRVSLRRRLTAKRPAVKLTRINVCENCGGRLKALGGNGGTDHAATIGQVRGGFGVIFNLALPHSIPMTKEKKNGRGIWRRKKSIFNQPFTCAASARRFEVIASRGRTFPADFLRIFSLLRAQLASDGGKRDSRATRRFFGCSPLDFETIRQ